MLFTITQISSKANIVAGVISFGMWLNDTDYMQRQLARGYAQEYKRNEYLYDLESKRRNPNRAAMDRYSDAMSLNLRLFKQCVDGLGYQY